MNYNIFWALPIFKYLVFAQLNIWVGELSSGYLRPDNYPAWPDGTSFTAWALQVCSNRSPCGSGRRQHLVRRPLPWDSGGTDQTHQSSLTRPSGASARIKDSEAGVEVLWAVAHLPARDGRLAPLLTSEPAEAWWGTMALQLAALASVLATTGGRLTVPIGTLFNNKDKDLKQAINAMSFAMQEHEMTNRSQEHVLKFYVDNIDTVDAYKLTKIICKQVRPRYFFISCNFFRNK